jgi:hypothetical protein
VEQLRKCSADELDDLRLGKSGKTYLTDGSTVQGAHGGCTKSDGSTVQGAHGGCTKSDDPLEDMKNCRYLRIGSITGNPELMAELQKHNLTVNTG